MWIPLKKLAGMQQGHFLALRAAVVCMAVVVFRPQSTAAKGFFDVNLQTFRHICAQDFFSDECDRAPYIHFCLTRPKNSTEFNDESCTYGNVKSSHFNDDSEIDFQEIGNAKGVPVPWIIEFDDILDAEVMLAVMVYDDDIFSAEYVVHLYGNMTVHMYPSNEEAQYQPFQIEHINRTLKYEMQMYCDFHYYGSDCKTKCIARNDETGHYTCQAETGEKQCMEGWTGENCEVDINECDLGICVRGICQNLPGDYQCNCPPFYSGRNCSIDNNPCTNSPCKNGGTCVVNSEDLASACMCESGWTGEFCEERENPCLSGPCPIGASCTPSADNSSFSCTEADIADEAAIEQLEESKAASFQPWHGLIIAAVVIAVVIATICCVFGLGRRRRTREDQCANEELPPPPPTDTDNIVLHDQSQGQGQRYQAFDQTSHAEDKTEKDDHLQKYERLRPTLLSISVDNGECQEPKEGEGRTDKYSDSLKKGKPLQEGDTDVECLGLSPSTLTQPFTENENNSYQDFESLIKKTKPQYRESSFIGKDGVLAAQE